MKNLTYYRSLPYQRRVKPVQEVDGSFYWLAWVEELAGCRTDGATESEAMYNLNDCFDGYVETMLEIGREIPLPLKIAHVQSRQEGSGKLQQTFEYPFSPEAENSGKEPIPSTDRVEEMSVSIQV